MFVVGFESTERVTPLAGMPAQVRNHDGVLTIEHGTYLRSDLPIAGFSLIEREDRDEAIQLVAGTPCAVAYGEVEVWPLMVAEPRDLQACGRRFDRCQLH